MARLLVLLCMSFALTVGISVTHAKSEKPITLDVRTDLTKLNIADKNAIGDGQTDDSPVIQAAIDYLGKNSAGGTLVFAPGVYRVIGITVLPGVKVVGADREKTIFRAAGRAIMFDMRGGELHNFTVYGTPDEASSGDSWKVGTGGVGKDGTAWASFTIRVGNMPEIIAKDVTISNVTAKEARYDCLYTRGSQGLKVLNCDFDRAGRNVISLVGNDEDFLIANCRFGSLFGLYHSDIEPNKDRFVRDGMILNCEFDGSRAGDMNTGTWGAMFIFSGDEQMHNRNIAVVGCTFRDIVTRVRGVFPEIQFLYNPQLNQFVKVRTNPVGEMRDATIRGNRFGTPDKPLENMASGVTFTRQSTFDANFPAAVNETKITSQSDNRQWEEDHPLAVKPAVLPNAAGEGKTTEEKTAVSSTDGKVVVVPLMGNRFNFSTGRVLKNGEEGIADVVFHADPLMAEGKAMLQLLAGDQSKPTPAKYEKALWNIKVGDVIEVRTNDDRMVRVKIIEQQKERYTIQYRFLK